MEIKQSTIYKILILISAFAGLCIFFFIEKGKQNDNQIEINLLDDEHHHHHFKCQHDEFTKNFQNIVFDQLPSPKEATLAHEEHLIKTHKQGTWQNIRILVDYSNVDPLDPFKTFIQEKLVPAALGFITRAYKVYPKTIIDEIKSVQICYDLKVPSNHQNLGVSGYDLVIYVAIKNDTNLNYLARASSCVQDRYTLRPVAGMIHYNAYYLSKLNLITPNAVEWERWIQTTIHEIHHILAFSQGLYASYINPATNQKLGLQNVVLQDSGKQWITLPNVLTYAQTFFNCPTTYGAPLEDNGYPGVPGSHWEQVAFAYEVMAGQSQENSVISRFTMELLKGSGWYLPDFKTSEPYFWGKSEGCSIALGQCNYNQFEFCPQVTSWSCSVDYMSMAYCTKDFLSNECYYWRGTNSADCRSGSTSLSPYITRLGGIIAANSRCWQVNLYASDPKYPVSCYTSQCSVDKLRINVTIGQTVYTCKETGQILTISDGVNSGTVTCPDIKRFCDYANVCPNDCSGRGTCRTKVCDCWSGFTGTDCSQMVF